MCDDFENSSVDRPRLCRGIHPSLTSTAFMVGAKEGAEQAPALKQRASVSAH